MLKLNLTPEEKLTLESRHASSRNAKERDRINIIGALKLSDIAGTMTRQYKTVNSELNQQYLNPYINVHRRCFFPEIKTDDKGKQCKSYTYKNMPTPSVFVS